MLKFNSVTAEHATDGKPLSKFQLSPGPERVQTYWGMMLHRRLPDNLCIHSTLPVPIFLTTCSRYVFSHIPLLPSIIISSINSFIRFSFLSALLRPSH